MNMLGQRIQSGRWGSVSRSRVDVASVRRSTMVSKISCSSGSHVKHPNDHNRTLVRKLAAGDWIGVDMRVVAILLQVAEVEVCDQTSLKRAFEKVMAVELLWTATMQRI